MLKETINYTDFNDIERTEDFYFHLSKAELMEMELGTDGGLTEHIKKIVQAKNSPQIIEVFKKIILESYGEKSADGRRFIKSPELSEEFSQTEAYSILFMKLSTDTEAAIKFVNGIIPKDIAEAAANK